MFRSAAQSTSLATGNGHPFIQAASTTYMSVSGTQDPTSKRSESNTSLDRNNQDLNTDDLFTKHMVLEIKAIQNRLR